MTDTRLPVLIAAAFWLAGPAYGAESTEAAEDDEKKFTSTWEGKAPPPVATFYKGDKQVNLRLSFNGYNPGPFSLFTSIVGWNDFGLSLDIGAIPFSSFTIGFGGTIYYAQAWFLQAITRPISDYEDYEFDWFEWEAGATFRVSAHYNRLQALDPYAFVGLGGGNFHLETRVKEWPTIDPAFYNTGYLRVELGVGLMGRINEHIVVGGELRYLISAQFNPESKLYLQDGQETATFNVFPQQKPSKGFSWTLQIGYRF